MEHEIAEKLLSAFSGCLGKDIYNRLKEAVASGDKEAVVQLLEEKDLYPYNDSFVHDPKTGLMRNKNSKDENELYCSKCFFDGKGWKPLSEDDGYGYKYQCRACHEQYVRKDPSRITGVGGIGSYVR